jgi:RNA polymerase sigma factor (sigma-70 family)
MGRTWQREKKSNRAPAPGHYLRRDKPMAVRLVRFIRSLATPPGAGRDPDAQLLERFAASRDEYAFAALLKRHGPMVLAVCRRVLNDAHDAEDAFQASFLVLARKAGSVRRHASVASWLFGVAYRTVLKARVAEARRRSAEGEATPARAAEPDAGREALWRDLRPVLDEEVARLPEKNRAALVLCYLEGRTTAEAAQALACPRGTVLSRLAWARERLRARLTRRGITLSAGSLATAFAQYAEAAPAPALFNLMVKAATGSAASPEVIALAEGVLRTMRASKMGVLVGLLLAASVLVGTGLLLGASQQGGNDTKGNRPAAPAKGAATEATELEVARAFLLNDALADEKYTGKVVRVTGKVLRVRSARDSDPDAYVLLLGGSYITSDDFLTSKSKGADLVLAFGFAGKEARKRLAALDTRQTVTVEGRCEGMRVLPALESEAVSFVERKILAVRPLGTP